MAFKEGTPKNHRIRSQTPLLRKGIRGRRVNVDSLKATAVALLFQRIAASAQIPTHLLELIQEGALVFTPTPPLHAFFNHSAQDVGDGIRTHSLQQVQPVTEETKGLCSQVG